MNPILKFSDFAKGINYVDELLKVCITRKSKLEDSMITGNSYHTKDYWKIFTLESNWYDLPLNLPVLNYDRKTTEMLLSTSLISESQIYNKIESRERVSSKSKFYDIHKNSKYISATVTDVSNLSFLKFPIVAKPDKMHSGLGIEVFNNIDDLYRSDTSKFTSFSEKINIKEEYRIWMWRDEIVQCAKRIPLDKSTADISQKKASQKTNFSYTLSNLDCISDPVLKACKYFSNEHDDLDFYAIDIAISKDNKVYVFEINSEPGPLYGVLTIIYQRIYEDYYHTKISKETKELLKSYRIEDAISNTKNKIFRISKNYNFLEQI